MILFILEGNKPDRSLYKTMMKVCGVGEDTVDFVYGCNIDALYRDMQELGEGADIVGLLKEKYINNPSSNKNLLLTRSDQISEIYLIFDYDFHDIKRSPDVLNKQLVDLLNYFNEETEHGKLYINYPMIEAIRYTKEIPDPEYYSYCVSREECRVFKRLTSEFSFYRNIDFLTKGDDAKLKQNWEDLKKQNVSKANYICNGTNEYPPHNHDSISQKQILDNQIKKYESQPECSVSVLSSFPLLMYDWLGE